MVWARKRVATDQCPKTEVTAESLGWIDAFRAWKTFGGGDYRSLWAREADALTILETELQTERNDEH